MHPNQCTLKASTVHAHAQRLLLAELDLENYKPVLPAARVLSLLLLACLWQSSLSGVLSFVKDPPGRETVR